MNEKDLEDQLSAMFTRRATDVQIAAPIELSPVAHRGTRLRIAPFAVAASVVAVLAVVGGSVIGIRSSSHPAGSNGAASQSVALTPAPTDRPTTCQQVRDRTSWQGPIEHGTTVILDHPDNQVLSISGTGEYLLLQTTPSDPHAQAMFGQATLAVFQGGTGQDVAALAAGSTDVPFADPAGAISPEWIAFGLARPQSAGTYYKVMLFNRHTHQLSTVDEIGETAAASGQVFTASPVIFGQSLYWIESVYSDRSQSVLKSYDLRTGSLRSTGVPGASSLLDYGIGLASVTTLDSGVQSLTTQVGAALAPHLMAAMSGATSFGYDPVSSGSGSLHWLTSVTADGKPATRYYTAQVDTPNFRYFETTRYSFNLGVGTGAFVEVEDLLGNSDDTIQVLDGRSGQIHPLPVGDELQAVVGGTAIFGTAASKLGATGLKLVEVSALPAEAAGC